MGLEAASFVNDLNTANPVGAVDQKSAGDDHLRLLKTVLKATFPLAIAARKFRDDDAGAADTLAWTLYRKSATPAVNDLLGSYVISGDSSTGVERIYARLQAQILDPVNTSEDSAWLMKAMVAGAETLLGTFAGTGINFAFPLIGAGKPMTHQVFTANGTWNRPAGCRFVFLEATGSGGDGGGVDGQGAGTGAGAGGGGSGAQGFSSIINVAAIASSTITIGAIGTGGSIGNGATGASTIWADGTNTLTWAGGEGGRGTNSQPTFTVLRGGANGAGTNVVAGGVRGQHGIGYGSPSVNGNSVGGGGGSGNYGIGGAGAAPSSGDFAAGGDGFGFGSGGGGGASNGTSNNGAGGGGAGGWLKAWELY